MKQENKTRIKVKRIGIRGDEVAILFLTLVFLLFLLISFFRLFAIGKLFDDFLFTFLFGWSKYLVYGFFLLLLLPIFLNFYFRIKASFIIGILFTFLITSWFVQNISIIINNRNQIPWKQLSFYNFKDLYDYFQTWWGTTIINNYHGFFAQPISFDNWNNVATFFPSFATGGIVANFLVYATGFGGFISSLVVSSILLFVGLSWVFLSKPWLIMWVIFFFLIPIFYMIKRQRNNYLREKKVQMRKIEKITPPVPKPPLWTKKDVQYTESIPRLKPERIKPVVKNKESNRDVILQDVIQESGTLAPFGQVRHQNKDEENN